MLIDDCPNFCEVFDIFQKAIILSFSQLGKQYVLHFSELQGHVSVVEHGIFASLLVDGFQVSFDEGYYLFEFNFGAAVGISQPSPVLGHRLNLLIFSLD